MSVCKRLLTAFALTLFLSIAVFAQVGDQQNSKTPDQLMDGEKVLTVKESPLLNPIFRQPNQVWFELQNVRPGKNLRDALEIDFAVEGEITGPIHVVVNTNGKSFRFPIEAHSLKGHQGVLKCSYDLLNDKSPMGADLEAYVELSDVEPTPTKASKFGAAKTDGEALYFKVSKSVTRGDVGTITYSRQMRDSEQRIFQQRLKKYGPPPPPPTGTVLLPEDVQLIPGTPISACFEGDWRKAEALAAYPSGGWVVHWPQLGHKANKALTSTHIAIDQNTIAALNAPDASTKIKPTVVLPKGSLQPPPDGFAVLPPTLEVIPGTPVKVFMGGGYWDYTVVQNGTATVPLVYNSNTFARRTEDIERSQIIIEKAIGRRLGEPKLKAEFAERLKTLMTATSAQTLPSSIGPSRIAAARSYPTAQPLPAGHGRASASTKLKVGDQGFVFWGNSWYKVIVASLPESGDVEIEWVNYRTKEVITRDSLAVTESMLGTQVAAKDAAQTPSDSNSTTKATNTETKTDDKSGLFSLTLESPGDRKIPIAKLVMKITKMNLAQANEVVENTPIELRNDLTETDALRWKKMLEVAGAKASVGASEQPTKK